MVIRAARPMQLAKDWARFCHSSISQSPHSLAIAYIRSLSFISRRLPKRVGARIQNSICQHNRPKMRFGPKVVSVGGSVRICLVPHLGEFDQAALFMKTLDYEAPVFKWLAANAPTKYDLVLEIGANVGVYTVFLDTLARRPGSKLGKIIAFEPAPEAFWRLLNNLAANSTLRVQALNAAVATASGLTTFFEPTGHLTNGSFNRQFAALFSDSVTETEVMAVATAELEKFLCETQKVLIKIDVEGGSADLEVSPGPID